MTALRDYAATICFMAALLAAGPAVCQEKAVARKPITFEQHVAPILKRHCFACHGAAKRESELDLRRRSTIERGGDSGGAIVRGKSSESLMIEMIVDELMPPEDKPRLSPSEIKTLRRWIDTGAAIAGKTEEPLPVGPPTSKESVDPGAREHWAFQPVRPVEPPAVRRKQWIRNPIDAFTLARLESRNWRPAAESTRAVWLRRVYFDLIGLPPGPEAIVAFEQDAADDAYENVVDRLLASPRYGERWAQHWLDVVRFAETEGFEYDRHLPDAWRFRDYVIQSFNDDKPFDEFIVEQIAGDETSTDGVAGMDAAIFHRLGAVRRNAGNPDIALSRNEVLTERTNIIGEAFLGLTVGCARCHNHKLEPITQKDYYRLQAYLAATAEHNVVLASDEKQKVWKQKSDVIDKQIKQLKKEIEKAEPKAKEALKRQVEELQYRLPPHLPTIPSIRNDFENRTAIHVLRRGVWELKGVAVGPRPLSVLVSATSPELPADASRPRTQLAQWIADAQNPLTARVIVNRVWQRHFGMGLVKSANDFGTHGERPSHPDLLDWLAGRFVGEFDWRIKPLHRLIVLSSAYRQASRSTSASEYSASDPENRLLWRFNRRRLDAEEIRDAMLAVSGRLNFKMAGPSVMVPVDEELIGLLYKPAQWQVTADRREHDRRSVYLIAKRNLRLPFMEAFDAPTLQSSCAAREVSTHAPQALELLNGRIANDLAESFAERLQWQVGDEPKAIVDRAYWLATGRPPTQRERDLSVEFLKDQPLREFALAILNLSEFIYVD